MRDTRRSVPAHSRNGLPIAAADVTQRFDYDVAGRLVKRRFGNGSAIFRLRTGPSLGLRAFGAQIMPLA